MPTINFVNGHMKGYSSYVQPGEKLVTTVYKHNLCGKLDNIIYEVIETDAITFADNVEEICDSCKRIKRNMLKGML